MTNPALLSPRLREIQAAAPGENPGTLRVGAGSNEWMKQHRTGPSTPAAIAADGRYPTRRLHAVARAAKCCTGRGALQHA